MPFLTDTGKRFFVMNGVLHCKIQQPCIGKTLRRIYLFACKRILIGDGVVSCPLNVRRALGDAPHLPRLSWAQPRGRDLAGHRPRGQQHQPRGGLRHRHGGVHRDRRVLCFSASMFLEALLQEANTGAARFSTLSIALCDGGCKFRTAS